MRVFLVGFFLFLINVLPSHAASLLTVTWSDLSTNEAEFQVERALNGPALSFVQIAKLAANTVSCRDTTVLENTEYAYRLRACNVTGCSPYSTIAVGKARPGIPVTPTNITVTP